MSFTRLFRCSNEKGSEKEMKSKLWTYQKESEIVLLITIVDYLGYVKKCDSRTVLSTSVWLSPFIDIS